MRRVVLAGAVAALCAAGLIAVPGAGADGPVPGAVESWCSPGGNGKATCIGLFKKRGEFAVGIGTNRKAIRKYKVCARDPKDSLDCANRKMKKSKGTYNDAFLIEQLFSAKTKGIYELEFFGGGGQLGPKFTFRIR